MKYSKIILSLISIFLVKSSLSADLRIIDVPCLNKDSNVTRTFQVQFVDGMSVDDIRVQLAKQIAGPEADQTKVEIDVELSSYIKSGNEYQLSCVEFLNDYNPNVFPFQYGIRKERLQSELETVYQTQNSEKFRLSASYKIKNQ